VLPALLSRRWLLEGSKSLQKQVMQRHDIPTAYYREFDAECYETDFLPYIKKSSAPVVLKADGLVGGKGVLIRK